MPIALAVFLLLSSHHAPGRVAMLTRVEPGSCQSVELPTEALLGDTTINLCGRWGVAANVGNLDDDPELEIVCRLSLPAPNNLNITKLAVLDDDLALVWSDSWGYSGNPEMPSVTLADIDLDGKDDIIVPMAETFFNDPPLYKCRIYALEGMTGETKPGWPFVMPGWPEDPYHDTHSEVVAADINADDTIEIIAQVEDLGSIRKPGAGIYVLKSNGDSLWKDLFYHDTLDRHGSYVSPAVADLDADGQLEIICHYGHYERAHPYPVVEKRLRIYNSDGSLRREWQTQGAGAAFTPDYASPTVGDINDDGVPEILVARRGGWLDVYDTTGTMLDGFPVNLALDAGYYPPNPMTMAFSTPALADLNGDRQPEIVLGTFGRESTNLRWAGRVHVLTRDGTPFHGFPVTTRNGVWYSPAVGDLNGDASLEIATSGCDSAFYVFEADGDSLAGWPRRGFPTYWLPDQGGFAFLEGIIPMSRTPFLVDIDEDGLIEILMEGSDGQLHVWDTDGTNQPSRLPCPTFRFNKERTGWYQPFPSGLAESGKRPARTGFWSYPHGNITTSRSLRLGLVLTRETEGTVALYDALGQKVRTVLSGHLSPGTHDIELDFSGLASGTYFVRLDGSGAAAYVLSAARIVAVD